ncbi:hypothetical protein ACN47E_001229 [Coniothyrium glycines]
MPKQRQTCTRCSQRRQKCDRKEPCTRCVQNNEGHLCTTTWLNGYNPSLHRKYPRKSSPSVSWQSVASSSDRSSSGLQPNNPSEAARQDPTSAHVRISGPSREDTLESPNLPTRLPEMTIGALLLDKDQSSQPRIFDPAYEYVKSKGPIRDVHPNSSANGCYSSAARDAELHHLQAVLPSREQVFSIVEYYEHSMLYWIGGIYHGPTFRKTLHEAYGSSQVLALQELDWRWTALLFSILSSGIVGSSETVSISWGFSIDEKYHINSVQAIYIMHAYEHLLGSTNQWIALRSVAVVIAKGLALHSIPAHPDDDKVEALNPAQKQAFVEREIGRRVWYSLVAQEWLCCTSQSAYTLTIQKRHFTTIKPMELDEETMTPVSDTTPTMTVVLSYFYDYALRLLEYHNAMTAVESEDDVNKYAVVLKFDGDLRSTCAETIPKCLSPLVPYNPKWPRWVAWARKLHQASINHKVIMVHQYYLSKSFKDVRYTYTRWACATAAKNVINIYTTREPDEPQWWIEQAFVVTAGICLILDLFHRAERDPEAQEYQACVQKAIVLLQQFYTSSVAVHGVRLLMSLLQEYAKLKDGAKDGLANTVERVANSAPSYMADLILPDSVRTDPSLPAYPEIVVSSNEDPTQFNFDIDALGFEDLMDYMPVEGSLNNQVLFDSMNTITHGQN